MKKLIFILLIFCALPAFSQVDRKEVRAGNRKFGKENYKDAEIDYRRALTKDSLSLAANYNLASDLYRQGNYDEARKYMENISEIAPLSPKAADYFYNLGDIALQKKDYAAAVDAFRRSLLEAPDDLSAKECYIYAKKMLQNQQNQQNQDQNKDQNQDKQDQNQDKDRQNQDQNQNQNQDQDRQNQDQQDRNQDSQQGGGREELTPQQAQAMLNAIQAKEKETQEKVERKKAAAAASRKTEKNW